MANLVSPLPGRVTDELDVLLMLERFIDWVNEHEGVEWVAMEEIAKDFRARNSPSKGAQMPKSL